VGGVAEPPQREAAAGGFQEAKEATVQSTKTRFAVRLVKSNGAGKLVILLAAAVTLGLVALTPATAANGQMPFEAHLSGTAGFASPTTVEFHGGGTATHLGWSLNDGLAVLGSPTNSCPGGTPGIPNVHTETVAAANGDELVIRMVDLACPTGAFTFHGTGHWTVLEGTGRFQDLTGQGTVEGNTDFETNSFELTLTGTLSYR
jgi:hypothetical protein